ncbi:uncharacterized protein VTP21DRAFT_1124 [Calcarisporiella thermophila]|uniref:uncharacterized protein n=1 Tax=Calcarisporiella thermophila TaxID=911321 RepID=UPI0037428884
MPTPQVPTNQVTLDGLRQRIYERLPAELNTEKMREFAGGLAEVQLASVGKLQELVAQKPGSDTTAASAGTTTTLLSALGKKMAGVPSNVITTVAGMPQALIDNAGSMIINLPTTITSNVLKEPPQGWCAPSEENLKEVQLMMRYAGASYCWRDDKLVDWSCPKHCKDFPTTKVVGVFSTTLEGGRGFVALVDGLPKANGRVALVSIRGTVNLRGWAHNFMMAHASYKVPDHLADPDDKEEPRVHDGFQKHIVDAIEEHVVRLLKIAFDVPEGERPTQVYVVGHSLGGATAVLTAIDLLHRELPWMPKQPVRVFTYGEPRVGNRAFARLVHRLCHKKLLEVIRVTNEGDPVPCVPLRSMGFHHHSNRWMLIPAGPGAMSEGKTYYDKNMSTLNSKDKNAIEEGQDIGIWHPLADPLAHLICWNRWFGPFC